MSFSAGPSSRPDVSLTFFNPVVPNETKPMFNNPNARNIDVDKLNEVFPNTSEVSFESEPYDDFSDTDPNYVPKESKSSTSSSDNSSDSEIIEIARQIESNLETLPQKRKGVKLSKRKELQKKRNLGLSYVTSKGITKTKRICNQLKNCRKGCKDKISFSQQKDLFDEYWALGNYNCRTTFLAGLISVVEKKSQKIRETSMLKNNRRFSCQYFLKIDGTNLNVCKTCFISTFGESPRFIRTIVNKMYISPGSVPTNDRRGRHPSVRNLSDEIVGEITAHINSFPAYESHYTRRNTSQKYLRSDLNLTLMHKMYLEKSENSVSYSKYANIFQQLNLKFKPPKLDICNYCEILKNKIDLSDGDDKRILVEEQTKHHINADNAYKSKEFDKKAAQKDPSHKMLTFDLQQCLPTPNLVTSVSFYKRLLWTYNLTIHDGATNQPYCYMWNEVIGKRGGNEIASCIFQHLNNLKPEVKQVTLYSDCCPGQNRNSFLAAMFLVFQSNSSIDYIDHKFLVVGHTHMECDVDHALIERTKKKTSIKIHHPRDWYQFVRTVGSKRKFEVVEMTQENIYNFSDFLKNKFTWRKVDAEGNKFNWNEIRWLRYTKDFAKIKYKTSLDENEDFKILNIARRGINSVKSSDLAKAYEKLLPISEDKKKDLLELLPLIDPNFHGFYMGLPTVNAPDYDPDLMEDGNLLYRDQ